MGRVASVQVGGPSPLPGPGKRVLSGIDKRPVADGARLSKAGVDGDTIGKPDIHGGPDQAVLFFAAAHYPRFEARLGRALTPGSFGENVTVEGLDETTVSIGDVFRVGDAEVQVTWPRGPCSTLARFLADPGIVEAIGTPARAGWYARVLREGRVRPGDAVTLLSRTAPEWTVERAARVRHDESDVAGARALARVEGLSARGRARLSKRFAKEGVPS
jgi:MOSC domain-containing protein YiiM